MLFKINLLCSSEYKISESKTITAATATMSACQPDSVRSLDQFAFGLVKVVVILKVSGVKVLNKKKKKLQDVT